MEEGVVVEKSAIQVHVWVNRISRVIPVEHSQSTSNLKIGSFVRVFLTAQEGIARVAEIPANGRLTVYGKELKILVHVIFPPRKLLSKVGLKLFSSAIGLISVNESLRIIFEKAANARLTVYDATIKWCPSSREFVLADNQQLLPVEDNATNPTYLTMLRESPWAESIEVSDRAAEILQSVMDEMASSSSSSDESSKTGILMGKKSVYEWNAFVLDQGETRDQWTTLPELARAGHSIAPYKGATVEIYLNPFNMREWCVVEQEESVVPKEQSDGIIMLDVAARAEEMVTMGEKSVTRLHNKRVMDVYDYNQMLFNVEKGDVVRVLIKRSPIQGDRLLRSRFEWVVHEYGTGEAVLPLLKSEVKKENEIDRVFKEFHLVDYARARDWTDNAVLRKYKEKMLSSMEEERREEESQGKTETDRRQEEEFLRHKQQLHSGGEDRNEFVRRKLAALEEENSMEEERGRSLDATLQKESSFDSTHWEKSDAESTHQEESFSDSAHREESDANSTRSSNVTQVTVIPARLPAFGHHLNLSASLSSPSTGSFSSPSRDSGRGSTRSSESTVSERERRLLAVMKMMEGIVARDEVLRSMIDREDEDWVDDLDFVLNEYEELEE